ncbi:MAG TPA: hemolysin III family protein [Streptosporangiaceae bacterium]|nr:hemolysin III family protein [Streptosporangiaceae bacterium]
MVAESPAVRPPTGVADVLHEARAATDHPKPLLRGWLHLLWFEVSLVFGTLLLVKVSGPARVTATAVYVVSVSALFGASALYHRGNWCSAWRARLQRLDQAMIFLLIAGTATPVFLLAVGGTLGLSCLLALWTLTIGAVVIRMARMNARERVVGGTFIALGLLAGAALPAVWLRDGVTPGILMLVGGVLYIAGALSYHRRWPNPRPRVFGFHEVFHVYVCAAATCQYIAIALFVSGR